MIWGGITTPIFGSTPIWYQGQLRPSTPMDPETKVKTTNHQKNMQKKTPKQKTKQIFFKKNTDTQKKIKKHVVTKNSFPTHLVGLSNNFFTNTFPASVKAVATLDAKRSMRRGNSSGTAATWSWYDGPWYHMARHGRSVGRRFIGDGRFPPTFNRESL